MVDWIPLKRWLFTTNHKDVGILYLFTSFYFFVTAGIFALTFRFQLAVPSNTFLQPDEYNQLVTTHGLLMLLWVITPLGAAFANYFVPIQIGARDMAFPRLNALSYWVYLASGMLALSSYFAGGGTADWGWTTYAPLNTVELSPAAGGSLVGLALLALMAASLRSSVPRHCQHLELHRVGPSHVHDGHLAEPSRGVQRHDRADLHPVRHHRHRVHLHAPGRFDPIHDPDALRRRSASLVHHRWRDRGFQLLRRARHRIPGYVLGRGPLSLHDCRRRLDRPIRRALLLVPQDHGSHV